MKPGWIARSLWLALAVGLLAASPFQGDTPPPTPALTLPQSCLDGKYLACILELFQTRSWLWLIVALLFGFSLFILRPYLKGWQKGLQKLGEEDWRRSNFSELERAYLEQACKSYRYFKFRGLPRAKAEGIEPPRLDQAYVSLRMQPFHRDGHSGMKLQSVKTENVPEEALEGRYSPEPINLTKAVQLSSRLAIIGAAGSGKSTLLQWAGLACARARLKKEGELSDEQREFIEALGKDDPPFPLLIPLRGYNRYCKEKEKLRSVKSILEFLSFYFAEKSSSGPFELDFFRKWLRQSCLVMFDGMDEVDRDDRPYVRTAVEEFLSEYGDNPRLRCLITSRYSAAYISDQMAGFQRCDVQPLTPTQRDNLVHLWYAAVLSDDKDLARRRATDLCARIERSEPRVRNLAVTPLMTTIFAMVHYSRDELPQQRAKLYEDAVEVLLSERLHKDEYAADLGMDWETRRDRLMRIAYELQERRTDSLMEKDLVDLIWSRFDLSEAQGRSAASRFLQEVADRGGLLEEQDGRYGFFTHATFREYLAGRYIAEAYSPDQQRACLEEHLGDDQWEETIRLAAGYLAVKGEEGANRFIRLLAGLGETDEQRAQALTLAGFSLADLRPERRLPDTVKSLTTAILPLFTADKPRVNVLLRRNLGLALGWLGDTRLDPLNPDMVPIPAGSFRMGTSQGDREQLEKQNVSYWDNEVPDHLVTLSAYAIGKYPVTNLEFKVFWEAHGYEEGSYWSPEGWRWRTGEWEPDISFYPEGARKDILSWLHTRGVDRRGAPFWWDDPEWSAPNLPVVGVCWFEAEAYCNWLKTATGRNYSLPTEAQWEKAARGEQAYLWPWGNDWDADRCNTDDSTKQMNRTTPVGMYPHGASPSGALDMAGNVWEWCQDWYDSQEYARRRGSSVVDPRGPQSGWARVVRGGSWDYSRSRARCASRGRSVPDAFSPNLGFRLVLSHNFLPGQKRRPPKDSGRG